MRYVMPHRSWLNVVFLIMSGTPGMVWNNLSFGEEAIIPFRRLRPYAAVSDNRIVTANGSATLEFAKELLLLLENDTPERIEMYYQFNKRGFCDLFPQYKQI